MQAFSVVIICRNEAAIIGKTLAAVQGLTDDIVVYDSESTDETPAIVQQYGARLYTGEWYGFGATKRYATTLAKYDWVLSLDADEVVDAALYEALGAASLTDPKTVYALRRKNYLGDHWIRYGEWGHDYQRRLFNRREVNWDEAEVHEGLQLSSSIQIKKLSGYLEHQTMKDVQDFAQKMVRYAQLGAEKYYRQGKKASWFKRRLASRFSFFRYYILKLGFLDGADGYTCAGMARYYTFLKYQMLRDLEKKNGRL